MNTAPAAPSNVLTSVARAEAFVANSSARSELARAAPAFVPNKEGSAAAFANALEGSKDEKWDTEDVVERKTRELAELCRRASGSIVVFTGAGISTACGIPARRAASDAPETAARRFSRRITGRQ